MADKQQWQEQGRALALANKRHQWERADWILEGIDLLGDSVYAEAGRIFVGYARGTFIQWAYVARAFPQSIRIDSDYLTFGHYQAVMAVHSIHKLRAIGELSSEDVAELKTQAMRLAWLRKADEERWIVSDLRAAIAHQIPAPMPSEAGGDDPAAPEPPTKSFKAARFDPFKPGFPLSPIAQKNLTLLAIYRRVEASALVTLAVEEYLLAHTDELNQAQANQSDGGVWERAYLAAKKASVEISLTDLPEIRRMYVAEKMGRKFEGMFRMQMDWASVEGEKVKQKLKNERFRRMVAASQALGRIKVPVLPLSELLQHDEPILAGSAEQVKESQCGALPQWEQGLEAA
jgi:hypothetical protein